VTRLFPAWPVRKELQHWACREQWRQWREATKFRQAKQLLRQADLSFTKYALRFEVCKRLTAILTLLGAVGLCTGPTGPQHWWQHLPAKKKERKKTWMWRSVQSVRKWQAPAVQQHLSQRGRHDILTSAVRSSLGFCLVSWRRRKSTSEHRPTATLHAASHKVSAAGEITSTSHLSHVYGLDLHAGKKLFCSTGKIPPQESIRNKQRRISERTYIIPIETP